MALKQLIYPLGLTALLATRSTEAASYCPPLGPVFPAPISPSTDPTVLSAIVSLGETFDNFTSKFGFSALSVGVQSIHEDAPLFVKHYTPPVMDPNGTQEVDAGTVFRLGSVTKIFTILAVLKLPGVSLDDPVVKYLPQLKGMSRTSGGDFPVPAWEDITLSALASHLGGIGVDFPNDLANFPLNWTTLGLPPTDPSVAPDCAGLFGIPACTATDFFDKFGNHDAVYDTWTSPVYSNIGYSLLGLVVEAVSNTTYEDFLRKEILEPLGMKSTAVTAPPLPDNQSFIATGDPYWGSTLGLEDPAGGVYSTTNDLLIFANSILNGKLLGTAATRKWLKPRTSTSSVSMLFGDAWEIYRSNSLTTDKRLIEFYTKAGDVGNYHSFLGVVPDYDIVVTVVTGGNETDVLTTSEVFSSVITSLIASLESAGRKESIKNFAGTYTDPATNSTLVLGTDDGPGFVVLSYVVRGVDFLANLGTFSDPLAAPVPLNSIPVQARLYPTNLKSGQQVAWRAVLDTSTAEENAQEDAAMFWQDASCASFGQMDRLVYQNKALQEFIFSLNGTTASTVALPAYGVQLTRARSCK